MISAFWPAAALFAGGSYLVVADVPQATAIVAGGIVGFAALSFAGFARDVARVKRDVAGLVAQLDAGTRPEDVAAGPAVAAAWEAYRQELAADADGTVRAGGPAAGQLNAATVLERHVDLGSHHAMPGLLVGIGITFTFLGLAVALQAAGAGVSSADVATTQAALKALYAAASFKFVASIAALACSVLYTAAERRATHDALSTLDAACQALDRRFPPLRLEAVLARLAGGAPIAAPAPAPAAMPAGLAAALEALAAQRGPSAAELAAALREGAAPAPDLAAAVREALADAPRAIAAAVRDALAGAAPAAVEPADLALAVRDALDGFAPTPAPVDAGAIAAAIREALAPTLAALGGRAPGAPAALDAQNAALEAALGKQREGLAAAVGELERALRKEAELRIAGATEHARGLAALRDAAGELQRLAQALGLQTGERINQMQALVEATTGQVAAIDRSYAGMTAALDEALTASNDQLKRYLEATETRQTHFFDSYDAAVTRLYEKLLQAANYLAEVEHARRSEVAR